MVAISGVSKKYFSTKFLTLFLKYVYILHWWSLLVKLAGMVGLGT